MRNWFKKILATLCTLALLLSCATAESPEMPENEAGDMGLAQAGTAEPGEERGDDNEISENEVIVSEQKSFTDEAERAGGNQEEVQAEEPDEIPPQDIPDEKDIQGEPQQEETLQEEELQEETLQEEELQEETLQEEELQEEAPADDNAPANKPEEAKEEIILNLSGRRTIKDTISSSSPYIVKAAADYSCAVRFSLTVPEEDSVSVIMGNKSLTLTKADKEDAIQYIFTLTLRKDQITSFLLNATKGAVDFTLTISKEETKEEEHAEELQDEEETPEEEEDQEEENEETTEETTENEGPEEELQGETAEESEEESEGEPAGTEDELQEEPAEDLIEEDSEQPEENPEEEGKGELQEEPASEQPEEDLEEEPEEEPAEESEETERSAFDETDRTETTETEEENAGNTEETSEQSESDSITDENQEDETQENNNSEEQPVASFPEGASIDFTIIWEGGEVAPGNIAHFQAYVTGCEGVNYTLQWQTSTDNENWIDIPDETSDKMDVRMTDEDIRNFWRVKAILVHAEE